MASTSHQPQTEIVNAFDGLAPPSTSASTSASTSPYDIFINHRGPDVKTGLATDIYNALHAMGLKVFLDSQELDLADYFPAELQKAMSTSSLHIAIFSPTYADSPWCLAELSFMVNTDTPIIPIFYQVEVSDVRHLKGLYKSSFEKYEEKGRHTDKLEEWKNALQKASFYNGEIINKNEEEQKQRVKNIVNRVLGKMKKVPLEVAIHPVGIEEVVAEFEMTKNKYSGVQIVGIWGMGGSGKTTLAKELYNKKYLFGVKSSFIFDIRTAKNELHTKQRQLLQDLGYDFKNHPFDNVDQGKMILHNYLRSLPIFVVLDDVDHKDQLEWLLPGKGTLALGSLIIITTRDKEVLNAHGISCIYEIKLINESHAKQLFCWHTFLQSSPLLGYENLVEKFIHDSRGLPLSLKVLGAQLYGCSDKDLWEDLLRKISRILPDDIIERLRVTYDALDKEEQQMFLDVACFFIGHDKMIAIAVWEGSRWSGQWGWEKLVNKCLVELVDGNQIRMHDHLRDLGRKIASDLVPQRLWSPTQLTKINKQEQIRGMKLEATTNDIHKLPKKPLAIRLLSLFTIQIRRMKLDATTNNIARRPFPYELKIFLLGKIFVKNLHIAKASELAWLRCTEIPLKNLPSWIPLTNLRVLELYGCNGIESLWSDEVKAPEHLRVLIVSSDRYSTCKLKRIPKSIGYLKDLKKICVSQRGRVKKLPDEFCNLQSLEHLQLNYFEQLLSLPSRFGRLTNLQYLELTYCYRLRMLPDSFKELTFLQHLNLEYCRELTLRPDILESMTRVRYLNLNSCSSLEELPRHITNQASLSELYLAQTKLIRDLPINIDHLSKLRMMRIGCSQMQSLPDSMGSLSLLEELRLSHLKLQSLPQSFKQLMSLQVLMILYCPMDDLDFGQTFLGSNLKRIELWSTRVSKITIFEDCCPHLTSLELHENAHLTEVDTLPTSLKAINVHSCRLLRNMSGIGGLVSLQYLRLTGCRELEMLPSLGKLASLKEFNLKGVNKVERIEGLEECTSLERLEIDGGKCWEASGTKRSERLQRLENVELMAKKRSTLLPCIEMIEKWPKEMEVCTKASGEAGSLLKSSAFPDISGVQFFSQKEFKKQRKGLSDVKAMIVCYIMKCSGEWVGEGHGDLMLYNSWELEEGEWVWMDVFTPPPTFYFNSNMSPLPEKRGTIGIGDEESVVKAFHRLLPLLTNTN